MREIDIKNWNRLKTYNWFKSFSNATYSCSMKIDVTHLVTLSKNTNTSFFINTLYCVVKGLNSIPEMRMRILEGKPVIYDTINPAYTVMTEAGTFENVRHKNYNDYEEFYQVAHTNIENAKHQEQIKEEKYNPDNSFDEYYITCLPWIDFCELTHPIPDNIESQCVPRICFGKYTLNNNKYEFTLNITVNHIFVDGYPLSQAFINIQNEINELSKNKVKKLAK